MFVVSHPLKSAQDVQVREFKDRTLANEFRVKTLATHLTVEVREAKDLKQFNDVALLALVNRNARIPVTRYASRELLLAAAFKSLEGNVMPDTQEQSTKKNPSAKELADMKAKGDPRVTKAKAPKEKKEAKPRERKPISYAPQATARPVREGTKVATMVDLLAREKGTTLAELGTKLSATGKPVDPRAWLGYDLNKVTGYGVREEEGRLYLVLPKGMKAPHPHKVKEAPKPKAAKAEKAAKPAAKAEKTAKAAKVKA